MNITIISKYYTNCNNELSKLLVNTILIVTMNIAIK